MVYSRGLPLWTGSSGCHAAVGTRRAATAHLTIPERPPALSASAPRAALVSRLRISTCAPSGVLPSLPLMVPCKLTVVAWAPSDGDARAATKNGAAYMAAFERTQSIGDCAVSRFAWEPCL